MSEDRQALEARDTIHTPSTQQEDIYDWRDEEESASKQAYVDPQKFQFDGSAMGFPGRSHPILAEGAYQIFLRLLPRKLALATADLGFILNEALFPDKDLYDKFKVPITFVDLSALPTAKDRKLCAANFWKKASLHFQDHHPLCTAWVLGINPEEALFILFLPKRFPRRGWRRLEHFFSKKWPSGYPRHKTQHHSWSKQRFFLPPGYHFQPCPKWLAIRFKQFCGTQNLSTQAAITVICHHLLERFLEHTSFPFGLLATQDRFSERGFFWDQPPSIDPKQSLSLAQQWAELSHVGKKTTPAILEKQTAAFLHLHFHGSEAPTELPETHTDFICNIDRYPLSLYVHQTPDHLIFHWNCSPSWPQPSWLLGFASAFIHLFKQVLKPGNKASAQIEIPAFQQKKRFSKRRDISPGGDSLLSLFLNQAQCHPDKIALTAPSGSLSYRALQDRAESIASWLITAGIRLEEPVAILLRPQGDLIAAILGVLLAGGSILPLDLEHPAARLSQLTRDIQPRFAISRGNHPFKHGVGGIKFLNLSQIVLAKPKHCLTWKTNPEHLAYLMFTSGSTGSPKAVMGTHKNLVTRLKWFWNLWPYQSRDAAVLKKSQGLIGFLPEVFSPLLKGVPLHVAPQEICRDPRLLGCFFASRRITRIWGSPSFFEGLKESVSDPSRMLRHVSILVTSGEMISQRLAFTWLRLLPQARLFNVYGSSEIASDISLAELKLSGRSVNSIGRPFAQSRFYAVNQKGFHLPLGLPGKLQVAGPQLARGYWDSPSLTAQTFRPDPFSPTPGTRIFETGDLAYFSPWHTAHLLGRSDHLLNLRGYRIAPDEIEKAITSLAGIRAAGVTLIHEGPYPKLVAFIVQNSETPFDLRTMRRHLENWVPQHMIPNHFQCVPQLPKTRSGKLDRLALAALRFEGPYQPKSRTTPQNSFEALLAQIWKNVLKIHQVGIHDHFFELGGHSMLATQIVSEIRRHFGLQLPLVFFFKHQTIAEQATFIQNWNDTISPTLVLPKMTSPLKGPITPEQQGIWLQHQLSPTTHQLHLNKAWRWDAPDPELLNKALFQLQQRHDSLRMIFGDDSRGPLFEVLPTGTPVLNVIDLREIHFAKTLLPESEDQAFDLNKPAWRSTLYLLPENTSVIWCCFHHLITDGWSLQLFHQELQTLIQNLQEPTTTIHPPPAYTFAAYARWRRDRAMGQSFQDLRLFWKKQLTDLPGLSLFSDKADAQILDFQGGEWRMALPANLQEKLHEFCALQKVSPLHPCLAIFASLLARRSGQSHLALLSPFANRIDQSLEHTFGMFVQTLILCLKVDSQKSFTALVHQSKRVFHNAIDHHGLSFAEMLRAGGHQTTLSGHPSLRTMFAYYPNSPATLTQPNSNSSLEALDPAYTTSQFDLTLCVTQQTGTLELRFQFRKSIFEWATIHHLGQQFLTLLTQCLTQPQKPLLHHAGVPKQELRAWYGAMGQAILPRDPIHRRVWQAAQQWASLPAFVCGDRSLTYAQLIASAEDLALRIQASGAKPGDLIAIFARKSLELPIAWLGCMFGGFVGMPVDPDWPITRIRHMLQRLNIRQGLLTAPRDGQQKLSLQWLSVTILGNASRTCPPELHQEWPAYAMSTSGSTGIPKTVVIPHASLANRFAWMDRVFPIKQPPRVLQTTPPLFDSSIWEMFWPLTHGGISILVPDHECLSGEAISAHIRKHQITMVDSVPSVFSQLLRDIRTDNTSLFPSLKTLILGSEQFPAPLTKRITKAFPHAQQWNLYGPTEATIGCIAHVLNGQESLRIPIGRAIDGTQALVFDTHLQPVPLGMPGDLYLAGRCLGTGYASQPKETAATFLPHPNSTTPGARIYQTGDVVRRTTRGELVFCGRKDHQLKLHGIRIEAGEIEAHLLRHPSVEACAVATSTFAKNQKKLLAYVVSKHQTRISETDIKAYLKDHLPKSHLPSQVMFLEQLPKNAAGKLDRKQLPDPTQGTPELGISPPRHRLEAILVGLFEQVLGIKPIGIFQSFFDLGGQSLTAMRLMAQLRKEFTGNLPLRTIFEKPTPELLAKALAACEQRAFQKPECLDRKQKLPLSFAQRRFWFLNRLSSHAPQFHVRLVKALGRVSYAALEASIQAIQHRHEILRLGIEDSQGIPHWKVFPAHQESLRVIDLSTLPKTQQHQISALLVKQETSRRFQLEKPPLYRHLLLRYQKNQHALIFTSHHILVDGWSMSLWEQELANHYRRYLGLRAKALPPIALQFVDLIHWQQQRILEMKPPEKIRYWLTKLSDVKPLQLLPNHRVFPGPKGAAFEANITLSGQKREALLEITRQFQTTPFIWTLSVFKALIHRYTHQEILCIGTPVAGRDVPHTEHLLGCFINTIPLATRIVNNPTFSNWLATVHHAFLESLTYQDIPFEHLIEKLGLARQLDQHPLFQALFVWEQEDPNFSVEQGLFTSELPITTDLPPQTKYDLTCHVLHQKQSFQIAFRFCKATYPETLVQAFAGQFLGFMHHLLQFPHTKIQALPLAQAKIQPNASPQPFRTSLGGTIPGYFAEVARTQPHAIAMTQGKQSLTYEKLEACSHQLAHRLCQLGFEPESVIAFSMPRSPLSIITMLGILKAGYAFLAIDPLFPKKRKQFIFADSGAKLLLQDAKEPGDWDVQGLPRMRLNCLDLLASEPKPHLPSVIEEQLAYIIYTSGSTGQPKGISVSHKAIATYIQTVNHRYNLQSTDRVLQLASSSFDTNYRDIFGSLLAGSECVLPFEEEARDFPILCRYLTQQQLSIIYSSVPAFLRFLGEEAAHHDQDYPSLRLIISGAEALYWRDVDLLKQSFGSHVEIFNHYGPSETCVSVTSMATHQAHRVGQAVPLGLPLPYAQTYLLNKFLSPIPKHAIGQIYIGGSAHARGYREKPRLTAQRFIPDPFSKKPGARLFDTGDLAVFCASDSDGLLFLGRRDRQVKIRGQRIELSEIESCLQSHSALALCATRLFEHPQKTLVAYLKVISQPPPKPSELRKFLAAKLTQAMIPDHFVILQKFPRLPNNKIDYAALPIPSSTPQKSMPTSQPYKQTTLAFLRKIWQQVLAPRDYQPSDYFFQCGGHSLLAAKVVARIRQWFGIQVSLRTVFENQSLGDLAAAVDVLRQEGLAEKHPPMVPMPVDATPVLSASQQRLWFLEELEPARSRFHIPVAYKIEGPTTQTLLEALNRIPTKHAALRTCLRTVKGQPQPELLSTRDFQTTVIDLSHLPDFLPLRRTLAAEEARLLFTLRGGPLFRQRLLKLGKRQHILLQTYHHLVADGWSLQIIEHELLQALGCDPGDHSQPAHAPSITYRDWAYWQHQRMQGNAFAKSLAFWKRAVNRTNALEMPLLRNPHRPTQGQGGRFGFNIPAALVKQLQMITQEQGCTLFMGIQAVFEVLLYRYSGQRDFCLGIPFANRLGTQTEGLVGLFANTLPIRTQVADQLTVQTFLERIRNQALEAFAHSNIPFESLVQALGIARNMSRTPLFQVSLVFHPEPSIGRRSPRSAHHAALIRLEHRPTTAKYDLSAHFEPLNEGLRANYIYDLERFSDRAIRRMAEHFLCILKQLCQHPQRPISHVQLAHRSDPIFRHNFALGKNTSKKLAPLSQLFYRAQLQTPQALALCMGRSHWTFHHLARVTASYVKIFEQLGLKPSDKVALLASRSPHTVAASLACFHMGLVLAPLSVAWPIERLKSTLDDAKPALLLHDDHVPIESLTDPKRLQRPISQLPKKDTFELKQPKPLPDLLPAYLLYTSGSTGLPKGILGTHGALAQRLHSLWQTHEMTPSDVGLLKKDAAFVGYVTELLGPLCQGRPLVLAAEGDQRSPKRILDLVAKHRITRLWTFPSLLKGMLPNLPAAAASLDCLKLVFASGESFSRELACQIQSQLPQIALINIFGTTELASDVCLQKLTHPLKDQPSIGFPMQGAQCWVQTSSGALQPPQLPGHLVVGGTYLAQGYWQQPGLTAQRFRPDPFGKTAGARLFFTGDLASFHQDQGYQLHGRVDRILKIRGYRIDPQAVEAKLLAHPGIKEAAIIKTQDQSFGELMAFLVSTQKPSISQLRAFLGQSLPAYAVPTRFQFLPTLPRAQNGKLLIQALHKLPITSTPQQGKFRLPRNEKDMLVASIWSQVLGVKRVGLDDNFFDLGGHSLLAAQARARLATALAMDLPLSLLFRHQTLGEFVRHLNGPGPAKSGARLEPLPQQPLVPSYAQERWWLLHQLEDGHHYQLLRVYRLKKISPLLLEQALRLVVQRHQPLQTLFKEHQGQLALHMKPPSHHLLKRIHLGQPEHSKTVVALLDQEQQRCFNLEIEPGFRAFWLDLDQDRAFLILHFHHMVVDAWGLDRFKTELASCYESLVKGIPATLPSLPVTYADYSHWQRAQSGPHRPHPSASFWQKMLAQVPPLQIQGRGSRPLKQRHQGSQVRLSFSQDLTRQICNFAQTNNATVYLVLLSAFRAFLQRLSDQRDFCIGTPVANRNQAELEPMVGAFVNTLALRLTSSQNPNFQELLHLTRTRVWEALDHQTMPFAQVVEAVNPPRDTRRHPLFQVMFTYFHTPPGQKQRSATHQQLFGDSKNTTAHTTLFDLHLFLHLQNGRFQGRLTFDTDLFDEETGALFARWFKHLLPWVIRHPQRKLAQFSGHTQREQRALFKLWGGKPKGSQPPFLSERMEKRLNQNRDAIALVDGSHHLSRDFLNRQASRLAAILRTRGVRFEVPVAVFMTCSANRVIAQLAIWRAGGVILPLHPNQPERRIRQRLAQAAVPLVLVDESSQARLPPGNFQTLLVGEVTFNEVRKPLKSAPLLGQQAAYLLFTSGSTGKPKLTVNHHAGILNRVLQTDHYVTVAKDAIVLRKTSFEFDVAMWEWTWPLVKGLRLELADETTQRDLRCLSNYIAQRRITHMHFVPSVLSVFLETASPAAITSLKRIFSSGEALTQALCQQWFEKGGQTIHNLYGPTEAAVDVSHFEISRPGSNPILGRPLPGNTLAIMNRALHPSFPHQLGQIFLGGVQLARGYHQDPRRTAQAFIPNPYANYPGERLYASGDLGRFDAMGHLHFHGRQDHQIKLRGIRIELGEIAAAIRSKPGVQEAQVIAKGQGTGTQLIAFVVANQHPSPNAANRLRELLQSDLPSYAIPNQIHMCDRMPQSEHGKFNPSGISLPPTKAAPMQSSDLPSHSWLWDLWAAILPQAPSSLDDDFFVLGGNSLQVVRLAFGINQQTGWQWPLFHFFQATTLRRQIALLMNQEVAISSAHIFHQASNEGTWLFVHPGDGLVHHYRLLADALGESGTCVGLPGLWEPTQNASLSQIAQQILAGTDLDRFPKPLRLIGWSVGGMLAFELAHQLGAQGVEVELLGLLDSRRLDQYPERLSKEPLYDFLNKFTGRKTSVLKALLDGRVDPTNATQDFPLMAHLLADHGIEVPQPTAMGIFFKRKLTLLEACKQYQPRPLNLPVIQVHSNNTRHLNDWQACIAGPLTQWDIPAGHETMLNKPHVQELARWLQAKVSSSQT